MQDKWVIAATYADVLHANFIYSILELEGIEAFVQNKKDSSYTYLGEVAVLVKEIDLVKTLALIKETEN